MKLLTETWESAASFFHQVAGLHDSTVEEIRVLPYVGRCILVLHDVYRHTAEEGFVVEYQRLFIEMDEAKVSRMEKAIELLGFDIIDAKLFPDSLWISTSAGSLTFQFKGLRFLLP